MDNCRRSISFLRHWPLWGVLLTGICSSLLWEHGDELLSSHIPVLLTCLIVLPIIGGVLTPAKPSYTVFVFAAGSIFPMGHLPVPIGLWPFLWIWEIFKDRANGKWEDTLSALPFLLLFTAVAATAMCVAFSPLVSLGWAIRRRWYQHRLTHLHTLESD